GLSADGRRDRNCNRHDLVPRKRADCPEGGTVRGTCDGVIAGNETVAKKSADIVLLADVLSAVGWADRGADQGRRCIRPTGRMSQQSFQKDGPLNGREVAEGVAIGGFQSIMDAM